MKRRTRIIDISLPVHPKMLIYPNNPPVQIRSLRTPHSNLSEISMGTHTGTHIDVPRHVFKNGYGVDKVSLQKLIGPCRVLDMTHARECVIQRDFERAHVKRGERILVKTRNSRRGFKKFYDDYTYLESDAASYLARRGIVLYGADYLSVKKRGSPDNRPHTVLLARGIVIFEGLDLSRVKPGRYFFVGLPLRLSGLDGSPVRALLIKEG